jgi:hypothetical protein
MREIMKILEKKFGKIHMNVGTIGQVEKALLLQKERLTFIY